MPVKIHESRKEGHPLMKLPRLNHRIPNRRQRKVGGKAVAA
jgi:hypothetical protein